MSILEQESRAHVMTESGGHVLGSIKPSLGWLWDGDTDPGTTDPGATTFNGWPYKYQFFSLNEWHGDPANPFTIIDQGLNYFDGTWTWMWFPAQPTPVFGQANTFLAPNPFIGDLVHGLDLRGSALQWKFGSAWKMISAADFNMPGPTSGWGSVAHGRGPDFGVWFVAKLGAPGTSDAQNNFTITWRNPINPGRYFINSFTQITQTTLLIQDDPDGTQEIQDSQGSPTLLLANQSVQSDQPVNQLISMDGTQVKNILMNSFILDTAILFGRATKFFPQMVFPNRNISLAQPPYDSWALFGNEPRPITAYPDYQIMFSTFTGTSASFLGL